MQLCKWQQEQTSPLLTTQEKKRTYRPAKPSEKRSLLHDNTHNSIHTAKKAIGAHASVEFYNDPEHKSTRWYKGIVIVHNKQGYLINFGPVFLIRSYGTPNGTGRCSLAQ